MSEVIAPIRNAIVLKAAVTSAGLHIWWTLYVHFWLFGAETLNIAHEKED
ncbi:hypothetical protein Hanom_Chr09g00805011 [Helianthus anomalus]